VHSADRDEGPAFLRFTPTSKTPIKGSAAHPTETLIIVVIVIFCLGSCARDHPGGRHSAFAGWRGLPDADAGHHQPAFTLLAIVLSVGLVVDDAIVMVENVERHLHLGQPPLRAAMDAARELVAPSSP